MESTSNWPEGRWEKKARVEGQWWLGSWAVHVKGKLGLPWHASRRTADQGRVTNVIVRGGEKGATSIKEVGHSWRTRSKGALMRILATHQCGLDSNSGVNGHNYEVVVGSLFAPRGFSSTPVFPLSQKSTLPNSNSVRKARTPLKEFLRSPKCVAGKQITTSNFPKNSSVSIVSR